MCTFPSRMLGESTSLPFSWLSDEVFRLHGIVLGFRQFSGTCNDRGIPLAVPRAMAPTAMSTELPELAQVQSPKVSRRPPCRHCQRDEDPTNEYAKGLLIVDDVTLARLDVRTCRRGHWIHWRNFPIAKRSNRRSPFPPFPRRQKVVKRLHLVFPVATDTYLQRSFFSPDAGRHCRHRGEKGMTMTYDTMCFCGGQDANKTADSCKAAE